LKGRELPGFQVKRDKKGAAEIRVEQLPDAESKFLLMNARLLMNYDKTEEVARLVPGLRKRAAKSSGSPFALRTLALAEIKAGDFDNADKTLAKLETIAPHNVNTPYLQALRYIEDGRARPQQRDALWSEARTHAARAFALNQNHYPSLYLYSLAAMDDEAKPSDNTLNALLRAYELAPNVEEFRLESAIALLRTGQKDEAKQLLLPLAYAPHSKNGAEFARNLAHRIEAGEEVDQAFGRFICDCGDSNANATDAAKK
jgi:predicted Zn-dependent protease